MERKQQHKRDLLRRWISGEITASEEAQLRKAAREDDFLRDALAGYDQHAEADHADSIGRLRSQLPVSGRKKVRILPIWRAAAAILLLATASWWLLSPAFENAAAPAMAAEQTADSAPVQKDFAKSQKTTSTSAVSSVRADESVERERTETSVNVGDQNSTEDELFALQEESALPDAPTSLTDQVVALDDEVDSEADVVPQVSTVTPEEAAAEAAAIAPPAAPPAPEVAPSSTYATPLQDQGYSRRTDRDRSLSSNSGVPVAREGYRIIEGKIRDSEGYPLIGASVLELGTSNGTVTDFDGYYRLTIPETGATLSVSYTGYSTQEALVTDDDKLEITLQEADQSLDEVVITDQRKYRRQSTDKTVGRATPEGGFRALKRFINDQTPVNTPRTRIRLQFVLQPDGQLTDFRVLSSSNTALNNFAIEVLQNGPRWKVVEGNAPVLITYTLKLK